MKINAKSIRAFRRRNGLTQKELAAMLEVSISTVRSWEYGRRNPAGLYLKALLSVVGKK